MTLNTFHHAGIAAKNVTLGVPRFKEMIDVSRTIRTPAMDVYLEGPAAAVPALVRATVLALEQTTLGSIVAASEVVEISTAAEEEPFALKLEGALAPPPPHPSQYVLRYRLRQDLCVQQALFPAAVCAAVRQFLGAQSADCAASAVHDEVWYVWVRFRNVEALLSLAADAAPPEVMALTEFNAMRRLRDAILDVLVKGVPGITRCFAQQKKRTVFGADGGASLEEGWVMECEGSNLPTVLSIEGVDATRTTCNDVWYVILVWLARCCGWLARCCRSLLTARCPRPYDEDRLLSFSADRLLWMFCMARGWGRTGKRTPRSGSKPPPRCCTLR